MYKSLLLPYLICMQLTNNICHARSMYACSYNSLFASPIHVLLFTAIHLSNSHLMDLRKRIDLSFNICAGDTTRGHNR